METLESSRVCRLCGQLSGISINIFDKNENHSKKINAVLPIMVHEMDLLPKQMCHRCSYKLEEFHKFYMGCLKTDAALKGQLSWMRKDRSKEKVGVPMVHIENVKIKAEPLDYDVYELEPLVEDIDYINSMSSVAFPAGGIHDGLTYAAFSRCQCCCDKKDQSKPRKTAKFFQDYEKRVSGCDGIADDSRKRSLGDTATRLRPIKLKAMLPDCPESRLPHVDVAENARDRLTTTTSVKDDVSSLETRNHSEGRFEVIPEGQTASTSTVVRNLRPRKNLVYYPSSKKRIIHINPEPPATSNVLDLKTEPVSNFEPMRQIKVEQVDEYESRNLRPRRNVIDYQEPKMRRVAEHRAKKRKLDSTEQNLKLHAMDGNALKFKIKQEVLDDLENTPLDETISATPSSPKKFANIADLPAKVEVLTNDDKVKPRDDVTNYLKILLTKQKSLSNIVKNRLAKTKKINYFSAVNYSPNRLRSQDTYLRNGKARNSDYAEWSAKRLQTRKLMDKLEAVNKDVKNMPVMLKLAESIKHYCETCNVSFMNKELLRLHTCYYD